MRRTALPDDPFEGRGARRTRRRVGLESVVAFALAIAAIALTATVWFQLLAPLRHQLGLP